MKAGRTLTDLAAELERQQATARDFRAPAKQVSMTVTDENGVVRKIDGHDRSPIEKPRVELQVGQLGHFGLQDHAHAQLGGYLKIPATYYDRCLASDPQLLAHNVNTWLARSDEQRLVRTLDGRVRGWLSNRYRVIDNATVAAAVLPILLAKGSGLRVESCEVTEKKLYIKVVNTRLTADVKKGDPVQAGIVISNSEVGCGAFKIEGFVLILVCDNGAILPDAGLRKYHIGRQTEELETAQEVFSDDTRAADDRALMLKMRDVVSASFDEAKFRQTAKLLTVTANNKIERDPVEALDAAIEVLKLGDKHKPGILTELIKGHDLSQWGLSNAITAYAQSKDLDYEQATELERAGGEIITLAKSQWATIATKKAA
jgi:hypothetical protein